jgi:hypothetical protein
MAPVNKVQRADRETHASSTIRKKSGYFTQISLVISLFFLLLNIVDFIALLAYREPGVIPVGWQLNLLLGHVIGFYFFLIGFIYSNEAEAKPMVRLSLFALALNLSAFIMRVVFEIKYIGFRPARYI